MLEVAAAVIVLAIVISVFFGVIGSKKHTKQSQDSTDDTPIYAKRLMTEHEKTMFTQLKGVPGCHIFCQVSLGAILRTKSWKTRNKFSQKIADFVVTDQNFNILAVIELDDKSHDDKQAQDKARDDMLKAAGYKVLRYRIVPSPQQLTQDILTLTQ